MVYNFLFIFCFFYLYFILFNKLIIFLGGLITGTNQLCEKYLPLSYEIELQKLKNDVVNKVICITINETTDCCG